MSNKTANLYRKVFQYIEINVFELRPSRFMTDFEAGLRKAINECYPGVPLHFCAVVRRKLLSHKL